MAIVVYLDGEEKSSINSNSEEFEWNIIESVFVWEKAF